MKQPARDIESRFIELLVGYRDQYRSRRVSEIEAERTRRHASDEVYVGGCWIACTEAAQVTEALQRYEAMRFVEIVILLGLLIAAAAGLWWLFMFLFLP